MAFRVLKALQVPSDVYEYRLKICLACKWYKEKTRSCGTKYAAHFVDGVKGEIESISLKGDVVRHYRKPIRLCGCDVYDKALFGFTSCPAEKWGRYGIRNSELAELRKISLQLRKTGKLELGSADAVKFKIYLSKLTGKNVELTNCPSCINDLLELSLSATAEIEIE
jgi:hypothetical protein